MEFINLELLAQAECVKLVNWPFVELGLGQESLLHQLEKELAHVVPCYLTALQSRLHPDAHKDVQLRAQVELVHALNGLLQNTKKCDQWWVKKRQLLHVQWQSRKSNKRNYILLYNYFKGQKYDTLFSNLNHKLISRRHNHWFIYRPTAGLWLQSVDFLVTLSTL